MKTVDYDQAMVILKEAQEVRIQCGKIGIFFADSGMFEEAKKLRSAMGEFERALSEVEFSLKHGAVETVIG